MEVDSGDAVVPRSTVTPSSQVFNGSNYPRIKVRHENLCDDFILEENHFTSQYFPFYVARLKTLKPLIQKLAVQKWGTNVRFSSMSEMNDKDDPRVIIIGILFKKMENQPTVLKEISSEDNQIVPQSTADCYIDDTDYLILQDETENVRLSGNISIHSHVTGIVVGLKGCVNPDGNDFIVEEICYPSLPSPYVEKLPPIETKYILLLSGLGFSKNPSSQLCKATDLLKSFITGFLRPEDAEKSQKISRVIIAGNLIGEKVRAEELAKDEAHGKPWLKQSKPFFVDIMEKVDSFLVEFARTIGVEIMPGHTDPTCQPLPQQPMSPCIIPKSSTLDSIHCVSNPYCGAYDSRLFIGSSGQNIDDIRRFSNLTDPIEIMEKTVIWSHLAPTVPDTLPGLNVKPDNPEDPFILTRLPDVYFVGNQKEFSTSFKEMGNRHIRFISIPKFETTFTGVLLNLADLTCEKISFG
ncbi:DNA polymerase delta subunit 2 [Tetranychus urticae]|uniref:DNA polymerase delta small subunit n=1 Tax=Tetranychus urticae TaxID=32264 RepID=T1KNE7_TETUR|nr:DNA polymerase delta subunit 2 [Tetranychus urticae]